MASAVFVLGSFVVDCAFRGPRMPAAGETVLGSGFALGPGGKGSNQAVAAARAGARVTLLTAIGSDDFGAIGRRLWAENGIAADRVKTSEGPTGAAAILLDDATGANRILVVPGACAALNRDDVDGCAAEIAAARILVAQMELPLPTVERGLALARAAGVRTLLNPAPAPESPLPAEVLRQVDLLVPNETEAERLTGVGADGPEAASAAARRLQEMGAREVVVTLGESGVLWRAANGQEMRMPAFRRLGAVRDTTGAGDAFCGALAAALAEGQAMGQALRFASAGAGLSVLKQGAATAMPARESIEAVLREADLDRR